VQGRDVPATVPAKAVVRGVFGFLRTGRVPGAERNDRIDQNRGRRVAPRSFRVNVSHAPLRGQHAARDHPLVTSLLGAVRENGLKEKISAMTASCDAWLYNNQARIPTVVFGRLDILCSLGAGADRPGGYPDRRIRRGRFCDGCTIR